MVWPILAIFAHLFWAFNNVGDKYIFTRHVRSFYVLLFWETILGAVVVLLIPFFGLEIPSTEIIILLLFVAVTYFLGDVFYFKAIQQEEVTRINILWSLIPVFTLIIAWLGLGEVLTLGQFIAFLFLAASIVLASLKTEKKLIRFSKAFWLMMVSCFFYAFYGVGVRFITQTISFGQVLIWVYLLMIPLAFSLFFSRKFRSSYKYDLQLLNKKTAVIITLAAWASLIGLLFNIWALSLGPAALVFAMESFQAIFVFIITLFFSLVLPRIFREEFKKADLILKITAMVFMVIGITLIYLS